MLIQKAKSGVNPKNPQDKQDCKQQQAFDRVLMSDKPVEAKLIELARLRGASSEEIHRFVVPAAKGGA